MTIKLYLFGAARLAIDQQTHFLSDTNTAVLALLALSPQTNHTLTRSKLAGTIWPDTREEHARQLLSNTLYRLKKLLGPHEVHLAVQKESVQLTDCWIDAVVFHQKSGSTNRHEWREAIELVTADLLEEQDWPWVLAERATLREQYLATLSRTCRAYAAADELEEAILIAHRWTVADPLDEAAHVAAIQLYARLGRYQVARQQYQTLESLLETELGVAPLPETQAVMAALERERAAKTAVSNRNQTLFVGRQPERQALLTQLDQLQNGYGGVALLAGEPGIGKTRLLEEVANAARWRQMLVAIGHNEMERQPTPYAPLPDLLQQITAGPRLDQILPQLTLTMRKLLLPWLPRLQATLPVHQPLHPRRPQADVSLKMAVRKVLTAVLDQTGPLLLLIDDLQWAGEVVWEWLPMLARLASKRPLLLVLAFREQPIRQQSQRWQQLNQLDQTLSPLRIQLDGLAPDECQQLAAQLGKPQLEIVELMRLSSGNPLIFQELLLGQAEDAPQSFERVLRARLMALSTTGMQLLKGAAVLGRTFEHGVWQEMMQMPLNPGELLAARLLTETAVGYQFQHDLVRAYVVDQMAESERQQWHAQAAQALRRQNAPPATIAWHFEKAAVFSEAVYQYQRAGRQALQREDLVAARQIAQQAWRLTTLAPLDAHLQLQLRVLRLLVKRAASLAAELETEADALHELAEALGDKRLLLDVLRVKSGLYLAKGELDRITAVHQQILTLAAENGGIRPQIIALNEIAHQTSVHLRNTAQAESLARRAVQLAETALQEPDLLVNALFTLALSYLYRRQIEEAMDHLGRVERLINAHPELESLRPELISYRAIVAQLVGEWEKARTLQHHLVDRYRQLNHFTGYTSALYNACHIAQFMGLFEEAIVFGEELVAYTQANTMEAEQFQTIINLALLGETYGMCGEFDQAETVMAEVVRWLEGGGQGQPAIRAYIALGTIRFYQKQVAASHEAYCQALALAQDEGAVTTSTWLGHAETAWLVGKEGVARASLAEAQKRLNPMHVSTSTVYFHWVCFLIEGDVDALSKAYEGVLLTSELLAPPRRAAYMERMPLHRDIFARLAEFPDAYRLVRLARADAPMGTTLTDEHLTDVWWTVDNGARDAALLAREGKVALRHHRLRRLVWQAQMFGAAATHADLAAALGVTLRTIERDSRAMADSGRPLLTRGVPKRPFST